MVLLDVIFEDNPNIRHQNVSEKYHTNSVYEENLVPRIGIFCLNDYWLPLKEIIIVSQSAVSTSIQFANSIFHYYYDILVSILLRFLPRKGTFSSKKSIQTQ